MSESYADLLRGLLPDAVVDICYPADPGANLAAGGLAVAAGRYRKGRSGPVI